MKNILYSDDEVGIFHPEIEKALKSYIKQNNLESIYEIEHHPKSSTKAIPDFVIKDRKSKKWIFVIEVKRTLNSVNAVGTWNQARNYVVDNKTSKWSSLHLPFFMVTNLECSYFLCDRDNAGVQFCLLKNGESDCGLFSKDTNEVISNFYENTVSKIFDLLSKQTTDFSEHMKLILQEYVSTQSDLFNHVLNNIEPKQLRQNPIGFGFTSLEEYLKKMEEWRNTNDPRSDKIQFEKISRDIARDCLFRIFFYEFCREYFKQNGPKFNLKKIKSTTKNIAENSIRACLSDLGKIDFKQILEKKLVKFVPENIDDSVLVILKNFLNSIQNEFPEAIKENGSPNYILNSFLENEDLYPWAEVNGNGTVMTDPNLSDFITTMCFNIHGNKSIPEIFDPGCGTGNFLSSSYDQLKSTNPTFSHDKILSYLHGCEVDSFLGKLCIFNLVMRSPNEISKKTEIDIHLEDFFETPDDLEKYDLIMMNPPFLRNDNKVLPLHRNTIEKKIKNILKHDSFVKNVGQPNYFFYFVELASNLLKNGGIAGFILMKSFLNSENGKTLKKFLLKHFELLFVISIPSSYFFTKSMVSPCVMILKKKNSENTLNKIRFVRVTDENFFNMDYFSIINQNSHNIDGARIKVISQKKIKAEDNWKLHVVPASDYSNIFETSSIFEKLSTKFQIKRGGLASQGSGIAFFFPWSNRKVQDKLGNEINEIEKKFQKPGLNNADIACNYILTDDDLKKQPVLAIADETDVNKNKGLKNFLHSFEKYFTTPNRWKIEGFPSASQIIIPRASRKMQSIHYNPFWKTKDVYFSSNFICLYDCSLKIKGLSKDEILQFVTGFLNSSFVQILFELESQDREGLRKIEKSVVSDRIFLPTNQLDGNIPLIKNIIKKFKILMFGIDGESPHPNERYELDYAVAELLLKIEPEFTKIASSPEKFSEIVEGDLRDLVRDRKDF